MSDIVRAWKKDSVGHFINMTVGMIKPYGINWTDFLAELAGDSILSASWTIPGGGGLTKTNDSVAGAVAIVELNAVTAGEYTCSHTMTSVQGVVEVRHFRVIVE